MGGTIFLKKLVCSTDSHWLTFTPDKDWILVCSPSRFTNLKVWTCLLWHNPSPLLGTPSPKPRTSTLLISPALVNKWDYFSHHNVVVTHGYLASLPLLRMSNGNLPALPHYFSLTGAHPWFSNLLRLWSEPLAARLHFQFPPTSAWFRTGWATIARWRQVKRLIVSICISSQEIKASEANIPKQKSC